MWGVRFPAHKDCRPTSRSHASIDLKLRQAISEGTDWHRQQPDNDHIQAISTSQFTPGGAMLLPPWRSCRASPDRSSCAAAASATLDIWPSASPGHSPRWAGVHRQQPLTPIRRRGSLPLLHQTVLELVVGVSPWPPPCTHHSFPRVGERTCQPTSSHGRAHGIRNQFGVGRRKNGVSMNTHAHASDQFGR